MLDDKKILVSARKLIVSHWFDVQQLQVHVTRGVINVQGHVRRLTGGRDERDGSESSLRRLDAALRALPSCRRVLYEFDNWIQESSGAWRRRHKKVESKDAAPPPTEPDKGATQMPPG